MKRCCLTGLLLLLAGCKCLPSSDHKDECRAGCPREESPCAYLSDTGRYVGYYVGGGAVPCQCVDGEPRTVTEGTWGWDYPGLCFSSKIVLDWWHGRREQGGQGDYRVDGPRPLKKLEQKKEGGEDSQD